MKRYENELYASGIKYIAGVDEVGRGLNAGDLNLTVDGQATPVTVGDDNHLNFNLPESSTEHTSNITLTYQGNATQFIYQYLAPTCEGIEHCLPPCRSLRRCSPSRRRASSASPEPPSPTTRTR